MGECLVAFPSTISTKYFSNFLGTRDPSCSLSHELCFVFRSSRSPIPATHWTIDTEHSRVIDERLNFRHLPRTGIFGMFMNKAFLHFHLQLVTLHTSSDLLAQIFTVFNLLNSRAARVLNREENSSHVGLPTRSSRCSHQFRLSSVLSSSRLKSHIVPLLHSSNPLQNLHGVPTSSHMTQTSTD